MKLRSFTIDKRSLFACRSALFAIALAILVSCSGAAETVADPTTTSSPNGSLDKSADSSHTESSTTTSRPTTSIRIDRSPVVRVGENEGVDVGGFNIGHGEMNEEFVELNWTEPNAASPQNPATFRIYRIETIGNDPMTVQLGEAEAMYAGRDLSTTDTSVEPDTFYTYILEVEVAEGVIDQRAWTDTLTTTDTTPPSTITGLTAEVDGNDVVLRWNPSTDDVEFASYAVSLQTGDGLQYLGGGADPGQTNFVDNQPVTASSTYVVQAVDFHNNRSEPVSITVERK